MLSSTQLSTHSRPAPLKPETTLILRAATYWGALVLANAACLGLMALLLFR